MDGREGLNQSPCGRWLEAGSKSSSNEQYWGQESCPIQDDPENTAIGKEPVTKMRSSICVGHSMAGKLLHMLGPAFCIVYFLWLAEDGLRSFFTRDDALNLAYLHGYFHVPLVEIFQQALTVATEGFRPVGGLFYRLMYSVFGFDPYPFRVAAFTLMAVNLLLAYDLAGILTRSREAAFIAAFLLGYNASFAELYQSTGTIYDILCFGFFVASFRVYVGGRQSPESLGLKKIACVSVLYGCALGSKEMAVSFPAALVLYELIYHPNQFRRRNILTNLFKPHFLLIVGLAVLTALYSAVKLLWENPLRGHSGYTPELSLAQFSIALNHYLPRWLYWPTLDQTGTLVLVSAAGAIAFLTRVRELKFGACFVIVALLPIAFILPRGGFAFYLPALGCGIFLGAAVSHLLRRMFSMAEAAAESLRRQDLMFMALRAVPLLGLVLALTPIHRAAAKETPRMSYDDYSRQIVSDLQGMHSFFPDKSMLYFDNDPYPANYYNALLYLIQLAYDNPTLRVRRRKVIGFHPSELSEDQRFFHFTIREGRVEPFLEPLPTIDPSQKAVRLVFRPEVGRAGENISVQAEELAENTIDIYWGWNQNIVNSRFSERYVVGMSPKWCSFDEEGLCTAPKFFGSGTAVPKIFPQSRIEILSIRESGEVSWQAATGVFEVMR